MQTRCIILILMLTTFILSKCECIKIREFVTRIVAQRQEVRHRRGAFCVTDFFHRWEFLRPFGSK